MSDIAGSRTPRRGLVSRQVRRSVRALQTAETDHPDNAAGSAYCRLCATCDQGSVPLARTEYAGSRAPWRTPRGLLSRRSVRLFGCRGATDRPGGGRVRFPMTRTVASDHVCCRRWAVRAHARCPAPRRVPSRHFQVSRSLMSNPGEEVGTNPSHASSTCGSMLRSSR